MSSHAQSDNDILPAPFDPTGKLGGTILRYLKEPYEGLVKDPLEPCISTLGRDLEVTPGGKEAYELIKI